VEAFFEGGPMTVFWLSFAGQKGWLGGCFIEATSFDEAVVLSHELDINPGGDVKGVGRELTETEEKEFREKFELGVLYSKKTLPDTYRKWE
jgi:hypothetical protein